MAVSQGNPYARRNWKTGIPDFSDKARKPRDKWIPSSLTYIRDVIEQVGARRVEQWDGTEADARWRLQAPAKTWREAGKDVEVEKCRIYSDDGEPMMVSQAEAEDWWNKIEPELIKEWQAEKEAAKRWFEAGSILRSALADEELTAYVLTQDGHQKPIERSEWLSEAVGS